MARTLYAGRPGDTVAAKFVLGNGRLLYAFPADSDGQPMAVSLEVWDEPDGTQLTDLLAADGTTPITEVTVPAAQIQIPAFYGPDGVTSDLWLKDSDGDYSRLDIGPPGAPGPPGSITNVNGKTGGSVTINAGDVPFTPAGGIAAATVQAAIAEIDSEKQPLDTDLTAIAALVSAANKLPYATGTGTWSLADLTAFARTLLDDADASSVLTTLGVSTFVKTLLDDANQAAALTTLGAQPVDADLTAIAALVSAANKLPYSTGAGAWSLADLTAFARTLLDDSDAATARATLDAASSSGGGREKTAALSATTGTCTGDLSTASWFTVSPSGNITLAFSNIPASGTACTLTVEISQNATVRTVTMPAGTIWVGGPAPTQVASKKCLITMATRDGGTTWIASGAVEQ